MLELSNHLVNLSKLTSKPNNLLNPLIADFGLLETCRLFDYFYFYHGKYSQDRDSRISILHFHSGYDITLFRDIQNLKSYLNMEFLYSSEKTYLAQSITRDSVVKLSEGEIFTDYRLSQIDCSDYLVITDETGFVKEYESHY